MRHPSLWVAISVQGRIRLRKDFVFHSGHWPRSPHGVPHSTPESCLRVWRQFTRVWLASRVFVISLVIARRGTLPFPEHLCKWLTCSWWAATMFPAIHFAEPGICLGSG
ncbi:uncharacterized protein BJX67DRAFT_245473 [Aspergillus lucknowensis]|uniref:Uncharacterized protein n=1 Tax=Aspergillus lucknowensis TaxID=176173 RepID=A0ABR4M1T7_9EURO